MKLPTPLIAAAVLIGAVVFVGRQLPKVSYTSKVPQATAGHRGPKGNSARQAAEQAARVQAQSQSQSASEA